jgi:hypothetical protein
MRLDQSRQHPQHIPDLLVHLGRIQAEAEQFLEQRRRVRGPIIEELRGDTRAAWSACGGGVALGHVGFGLAGGGGGPVVQSTRPAGGSVSNSSIIGLITLRTPRWPGLLLPNDLGNALAVNQHKARFPEKENLAVILGGAEIPRLAEGVFPAVVEPHRKRPEGLSLSGFFDGRCVHRRKLISARSECQRQNRDKRLALAQSQPRHFHCNSLRFFLQKRMTTGGPPVMAGISRGVAARSRRPNVGDPAG